MFPESEHFFCYTSLLRGFSIHCCRVIRRDPPSPVLYSKSATYSHPSTWQEINAGNRVACTRKTQHLIIKESDSVPNRLVPLACRAAAWHAEDTELYTLYL